MSNRTILIAPNSFKECADSVAISNLIYSNLAEIPGLQLIKNPISDGGDGFLPVCTSNFNLKLLDYPITTPYSGKKFLCRVGYDEINKIVYIESANVLGMKIIPTGKRHPVDLSSKGMGELLKLLAEDVNSGKININKAVIGIGGTGTNDLGIGMASIFGFEIYDLNKNKLKAVPADFMKAGSVKKLNLKLPFKIELVIDVDNPLLGKNGSTMIYGRQKGSTKEELEIIESGFNNLIDLFIGNGMLEPTKFLSGAGGGLAAGFQIFFNAGLIQSDKFIAEGLKPDTVKNIDLIITGEGAFDEQSFMKKATGSLIEKFKDRKIPVLLVCGTIDKNVRKKLPAFVTVFELVKIFGDEKNSIKNFVTGLNLACTEARKLVIA